MTQLAIQHDRFKIRGLFSISRGSRTHADVVTVTLSDGDSVGRGECTPYARYGETVQSVTAEIEAMRAPLAAGLNRQSLQSQMPSGAARNAIDCALWDLEAKRTATPAFQLAGLRAL